MYTGKILGLSRDRRADFPGLAVLTLRKSHSFNDSSGEDVDLIQPGWQLISRHDVRSDWILVRT